jgi:hypothetical protein
MEWSPSLPHTLRHIYICIYHYGTVSLVKPHLTIGKPLERRCRHHPPPSGSPRTPPSQQDGIQTGCPGTKGGMEGLDPGTEEEPNATPLAGGGGGGREGRGRKGRERGRAREKRGEQLGMLPEEGGFSSSSLRGPSEEGKGGREEGGAGRFFRDGGAGRGVYVVFCFVGVCSVGL